MAELVCSHRWWLLGALLMLGTGQAYRVRAKQEELETVLGGTPFMLTRCGRDLRYRLISESYGQMLGLRPKDVVGKTIARSSATKPSRRCFHTLKRFFKVIGSNTKGTFLIITPPYVPFTPCICLRRTMTAK